MKKNYIGLWSLLAVALAVVIIISCFDNISVFGVELKSSGIAHNLTVKDNPCEKEYSDRSIAEEKTEPEKIETDTAAQNILIIGDSMLEGLNPRLAAYADKNGHTIHSVIWYSSTTKYFGESDTLKYFIRKYNPSFIFHTFTHLKLQTNREV